MLMLMIILTIMTMMMIRVSYDYDDDTDDDNDHKKDSYTAAGAAPTQTRPGHARQGRAKPDPKNTLFWHEMGFR